MTEATQSRDDLLAHLADAVKFLSASAQSFDRGVDGEAKRMASTVRMLCHDTTKSHSLLAQLGLKSLRFYDTAGTDMPGNLLTFTGLAILRVGGQDPGFVAPLDDLPPPKIHESEFQNWWNALVLDDRKGNRLTRRDVVLQLANKDGGVHVDPNLDPSYAAISRSVGFGWIVKDDKGTRPMPGRIERVTMRQIAHEVLTTLSRNGHTT